MHRQSDSDSSLLDALPVLFENPFDTVESIIINSNSEAQNEINKLITKLDNSSEWDEKCDAIKRAISLLKGGALNFSDFDLLIISPKISSAVTDLRSSLVKWGSLFAVAAAHTLGIKFSPLVDIFIPSLFKQATHGTAIISQSCRYGIQQIVTKVPSRKTIKSILNELNSKSIARRRIVAECLKIITTRWPQSSYQQMQLEVSNAITKLKSDASQEIRNVFRSPSSSIIKTTSRSSTPVKLIHSNNKFDSLKEVSQTPKVFPIPVNSNRTLPTFKFFSLVAPKTSFESISFGKQILNIFENGHPGGLKKISKIICESLPNAIQMSSDNNIWNLVVPNVFKKFRDEIGEQVGKIILNSNFNIDIISSALANFDIVFILSIIHNDEDKLKLTKIIQEKFIEYELPEIIIKKNIFKKIIEKINKNEDFNDLFNKLDNISEIESSYEVLINLIDSLNDEIKLKTLNFIELIFLKFENIYLPNLFDSIIKILKIENNLLIPICERCLYYLFPIISIEEKILPLIKNDSPYQIILISIISNYLEITENKSEILRFSDNLSEYLLDTSESSNITLRRSSIMCFLYFSNLIGNEYIYINKLNQQNQLLIKKYQEKFKKK